MKYFICFFSFTLCTLPSSATTNLYDAAVALQKDKSKDWYEALKKKVIREEVMSKNSHGETPLHIASELHDNHEVSFLLKYGANPNVQDRQGQTALHKIINSKGEYGEDIVRMLMAYGADPGLKDKKGKVPAQYARDSETLKALVRGALNQQSMASLSGDNTEADVCWSCEKGKKGTVADVTLLNRRACEQTMKREECQNTPDLLKRDCKNLKPPPDPEDDGWVLWGRPDSWQVPFCHIGGSFAGMLALMPVILKLGGGTSSIAGRLFGGTSWGLLGMGAAGAMYVANLYEKAVKQTYREARKLKWHRAFIYNRDVMESFAREKVWATLAGKLYNVIYGDSHCYNQTAYAVRVCGVSAAIGAALSTAGGAAGVGAVRTTGTTITQSVAAQEFIKFGLLSVSSNYIAAASAPHLFHNEFEKVRRETLQTLQAGQTQNTTENVDRLVKEVTAP